MTLRRSTRQRACESFSKTFARSSSCACAERGSTAIVEYETPTPSSTASEMIEDFSEVSDSGNEAYERRVALRYGVLTFALFVPLLVAFVFVRNLYPFAASTEMMEGGDPQAGRTYYVLRGETVAGETF